MNASWRRALAASALLCALAPAPPSAAAPEAGSPLGASIEPPAALPGLAAAPDLTAPLRYPETRLHSPMTRDVVEHLRAVLARSPGRRDVFVKIGDSNTVNRSFLTCFAGDDVRLGAHAALAPTLAFFRAGRADAERTSFDRVTEAAAVGWLAGNVLAGDPAPLEREIAAVRPAFALVMLGTNDNRPGGLAPFARHLAEIIDRALALGVVPLVSTIPPRTDSPAADARVPELNAAIRALAGSRRVPLMDLHAALLPLRGHGLAADGIHLQMAVAAGAQHGCWLTHDALQRGMNVRNLVALTALDRARRFLLDGEPPEDDPAGPLAANDR
ncbi:MAG: SGNH/GDSL hydrolase family protein [Polyangiaceae bacterium]|nr:SGNH/GDSL hydrolase family protein [Polyangiaceae bacterium]